MMLCSSILNGGYDFAPQFQVLHIGHIGIGIAPHRQNARGFELPTPLPFQGSQVIPYIPVRRFDQFLYK